MKRSIIITLTLIAAIVVQLCASSGWARGLGVLGLTGGGVITAPAEYVCAGDFLAGDNESFEAGEDLFCTTNISKTAGDSYSTSFDNIGTHGYVTSGAGWVQSASLATADSDVYMRFVWKPASLSSGDTNFIAAASDTNVYDYHQVNQIKHYNSGGNQYIALCTSTGDCTTADFAVTAGDKYAINMHIVGGGGTSTMQLYRCSGGTWTQMTTGESATTLSKASTTYSTKIVMIGSSSSSYTESFDDFVFDVDATDYIGNPSCE